MLDLVIKNAVLFTVSGRFEGDIAIKDGKIVKIGDVQEQSNKIVNAQSKYVLPGLVDGHTHMEMPFMGTVTADDYYVGSKAALAGGVTTIVDFILPSKGEDLITAYERVKGNADKKAIADFGLHMIIREATDANLSQLKKLIVELGVVSYKMFMAYKGELLVDDKTLFKTIREISKYGGVAGIHAENGEVIDEIITQFVLEGKVDPVYHAYSRPEILELEAINRVASMASVVPNSKLYIVHTSIAEGADVMTNFRRQGLKFFTETCPHYLVFNVEVLKRKDGYRFVCTPPFRSEEQRTKLWQRLAAGEIFTVGSDHAAFTEEQKKRWSDKPPSFHQIPNGVPGVETILPILHHYGVRKGVISFEQLVEVTSYNPAKLYGLYPRKGAVIPGADADFVIFDPNKKVRISPDVLHSNLSYTIYDGIEVEGWTVATIRRGEVVHEEGQVFGEKGSGKYIKGQAPVNL